jgi:hypothetical protein
MKLDGVLMDSTEKHLRTQMQDAVSSLKNECNNASNQMKTNSFFYTFFKNENNVFFIVCKILNHFAMQI